MLNTDAAIAVKVVVEPWAACSLRSTKPTTRTGHARWPGWLLALMAAVLAVVSGLLGAIPASAAPAARTYDTAAYTYDAPAHLSSLDTAVPAPRGSPAGPCAASWMSHVVFGRFVLAANTGAGVARPLSQVESRTLADALRPDKLSHVFDPKHNFGPLVETYGSEAGAMEQIVRSLDRAALPRSGLFEVTTQVGGQGVVVRGAVVDGVARIGTAFTP